MKIEIKKDNLIIIDDNVRLEEPIYEYGRKISMSGAPFYGILDVRDDMIDQFVEVLDELMYHRQNEYDSSGDLIFKLFSRLTLANMQRVLWELDGEFDIKGMMDEPLHE